LYDILIKNGVVIDPSQGLHEKRDIAITKGKIESMEKDILESATTALTQIPTPSLMA
jgi:predicted amidohydrolase